MSRKRAITTPVERVPQSPQEAFQLVVYNYGVSDMAAALLIPEGTLYNKCNAGEDSHHKPTLNDVVNVTRVSGDTRILESLDRMFGRAGYELAPGPVNDAALMDLLCKVGAENGAMYAALQKGLADGKFTSEEFREVRGEGYDLISAVLNFLQRLEGLVDA